MRPALILYPKDDQDVIAAIKYAKKHNIAVAVRTGGHQYSGSSSTGGDNIQLDLSRTYMEFEWDNVTGLLRVGVSWALLELDAKMGTMGLFVPHGQCRQVHVGGHAQSGGYGSLCRGFGLFADNIEDFEIITADGHKRTVHRGSQGQEEKDLFFAVLGGSPGNFGVLTHVTLRPHHNTAHLESRGLKTVYLYTHSTLKALLDLGIQFSKEDDMPADYDYCVTLSSATNLIHMFENVDELMLAQNISRNVSIILVFAQWANLVPGEAYNSTWFDRIFNATTQAGAHMLFQEVSPVNHTAMSTLSAKWVFSAIREFTLPFEKRTHLSSAVGDGWVDWISDVIAAREMDLTDGLHLVGQFQLLGGNHSKFQTLGQSGETSYSWRDSTFIYTLDAFYELGDQGQSKANAVAFQNELATGLANFASEDRRVLWASFGDHNMRNVWHAYYDSVEKYERLVAIKKRVDPNGIFTPNAFVVGGDRRHGKGKRREAQVDLPDNLVTDEEFAPRLNARREALRVF